MDDIIKVNMKFNKKYILKNNIIKLWISDKYNKLKILNIQQMI